MNIIAICSVIIVCVISYTFGRYSSNKWNNEWYKSSTNTELKNLIRKMKNLETYLKIEEKERQYEISYKKIK